MPGSMNIQWGTAAQHATGQATLRPTIDSEQQVEFASSAGDALWLAFGAAAFSPGAMYAKAPIWRWVIGGGVVLLPPPPPQRAFLRARLSPGPMQRPPTHSYGYLPRLSSDDRGPHPLPEGGLE